MFNFFKQKIAEEAKPELYHCSICKSNYREEDIDFFASRRLSKNVCVGCTEYIKNKSIKEKEVFVKMKDLETIIKNRDALKKSIDDIWEEIYSVKSSEQWSELSKEEQVVRGKLLSLKNRYYNQMVALDFVLNENNGLLDYRTDSNYEGFLDKRFFADVNVR